MSRTLASLMAIMTSACASATSPPTATYQFENEIILGGVGGWDYLAVDSAARRLYVTHETEVVVINLETGSVVGKIAGLAGAHGIAIAPELKRGFVTSGRDGSVRIIDLDSLDTVGKVSAGMKPDAIVYEPSKQEVYAFNGNSSSATVFGAATGEVITTIALPGKPEFSVLDRSAQRIYVNIENKNTVAVIDIATHKLIKQWPIAPGESATGMAFDAEHHRLFLGADNKLMVMMDSDTGKVLSTVPIGAEVDATAFDAETQLAFSSNGEGTVTIAHLDSPNKLSVVRTLKTSPGAKTMTLDPTTHRIYLSVGSTKPEVNRSFKVLVYGLNN